MRRLIAVVLVVLFPFVLVSSAKLMDAPDALAPKIFNASQEAKGGDVIFLQGAHFDPSTRVMHGTDGATPLEIVNRVEQSYLAVQLPIYLAKPPLLRVVNDHGASAVIRLNGARPQHIDATQIVPGGRFRIFGRALKVAGVRPRVSVDGQDATIDLAASGETMLVVRAPDDVKVGSRAEILCDNGNGTGPADLGRTIPVGEGTGDPLGLGVGWAAGFTFADRVIDAGAACDGKADDTQTIGQAISNAAQTGGGVVRLPAGVCRITGTINLATGTVLRGAGRDATILRYEGNYPISAEGFDLVGLQDLQLVNTGPVQEGVVWRKNTRSFIQRVIFKMGKSRQWFLTDNRDMVFDSNVIEQTGSYDQQNPYRFDASSGLVFTNNVSINQDGSPTFRLVHDAAFLRNRFTRDASSQHEAVVVAHHSLVLDFSYRISVIGNQFDVANGPIDNVERNDGEAILVEGGGAERTEKSGTVSKATSDSVTARIDVNLDPFGAGLPENLGLVIVSGEGAGQVRHIMARSGSTLKVDRAWDVVPAPGSHVGTFVWGLETATIKDNVLKDNPRSIWLYQSAIDDVAVEGNTIIDGGGIYLRSYQDNSSGLFTAQFNTTVTNNTIVDKSGRWMGYIIMANVRKDRAAFGIGQLGIEIRRNAIAAHVPNVTSQNEEYASQEGYVSLVHVEAENGETGKMASVLGPIFQANVCRNCESAFTIGTGNVGAVLVGNRPGNGDPAFLTDRVTLGNGFGGSSAAYVR